MAFDATTDFVKILCRTSSSESSFSGRLEVVEQSVNNILRILQRLEESRTSDATATREKDSVAFERKKRSSGNQLRSLNLANQKSSDPLLDVLRCYRFPSLEQLVGYVEGFFGKSKIKD
ncbi:hypothetical protein N7453_007994 [Penicillium expansum]|nr:hypothetical protein N7453_007994 [Penicillium expansum]